MFRPLSLFNRNAPTARDDAPADPFYRLHDEMNRLFDDAFRSFGTFDSNFSRPSAFGDFGALGSSGGSRALRIDARETDDAIEIEAELPGVDERDIDVQLSDSLLTIRGEKKFERKDEKDGEARVMERAYGSFARSFTIPYNVDPDAVEATFKNGVLKLSLPKPPEQVNQTRKIAVKRG